MANAEQLEILKAGVNEWNTWRVKNKEVYIDLSEADLSGMDLLEVLFNSANLSNTKLSGTHLNRANLFEANLSNANLSNAELCEASLIGAKFLNTNLSNSKLSRANLLRADLSKANLYKANLFEVNLTRAKLENTDFNECFLAFTVFGFTNLSTCRGLDTVQFRDACTIDFQTLRTSKNLPKSFLLKIGLPEHYIDYLPDFYGDSYLFPAFLSHSWENKPFVRNLYEALIGKGVNVFLDEKKMKPGDDLYESISKGIQDYDKMILVCSKESLTESWWVDKELDRVFAKERELQKKHGKRIDLLIPIRLDDYIFEWKGAKAEEVRRYIIGDFRPEADFEKSLNDLVNALHVERPDVKPPSFL